MSAKIPRVRGYAVSQRTLVIFTRQLSTMIHSSVPMVTAFTALIEATEDKNFKDVLVQVRGEIQEGVSLSDAFAKYPRVFSRLYVSTVAAGEEGGVLDAVLKRLADLLEHEVEIQTNVRSALRYPITVIIAITAAFFVLTTLVVPRFVNIFQAAGVTLPMPTRILILIDNAIRHYWFFVIPSIVVVVFVIRMYFKTRRGAYQWDYMKLKMPVFGSLFIKMFSSRFAQMLMTLDKAGLPILKSLDVIALTLGNAVFAKEVETLRKSVSEGKGIGEPLLRSKFFPRLVAHMVSVGEKSGAMDDMLASVQQHYDGEVNSAIRNLTALIEPLLTVGLGLIVLFLALGIYMPMWDLMSAVKGGG